MPIYMDVHTVPGVKAKDVAAAHTKDVLHQHEYGCKCMTYWIDEARETIFCLIDAPDKDAVKEMHSKAHGLIPNKIIEVSSNIVESFLGRIYDPEEAEITSEGLKVFSDPSFRVLLVTKTTDPVLLKYQIGKEQVTELLSAHNKIVRSNLISFGGREVEHSGSGFIVSFSSAGKAVSCALSILEQLEPPSAELLGFKISLNAGEPIEKSNKLFGDAIHRASHMCTIAQCFQIAMASTVKDLVAKNYSAKEEKKFFSLSPQDEKLMESIYGILDENWQDADFDVEDYCRAMAMSKSQLYRKTIALTGLSPNLLLKEYRLERAKELMNKQHYNISQITFDSGFTSPSYFTKCFKKKYGILPMDYVDLLQ
jgi:AraC-like DNA-binding protein